MKIRGKSISILLMAVMLLVLAACGDKEAPAEAERPSVIRQGYLEKSVSEQRSLDHWTKTATGFGDIQLETFQYPSVNEMLLDLNAGKLDSITIPSCTADYLTASDDQLINLMPDSGIYEDYCMATREEDSRLCASLNDAVKALKTDGTLEELVKTYLVDVSGTLSAQETAKIDGAPVYKVGVTGDYPPFDYVSADGTPAGFNAALLNAISEKASINFEIVQVEAPARLTALASGKIDVVFWMGYTQSGSDQPSADGLCLTDAYHRGAIAAVAKKSAENMKQ